MTRAGAQERRRENPSASCFDEGERTPRRFAQTADLREAQSRLIVNQPNAHARSRRIRPDPHTRDSNFRGFCNPSGGDFNRGRLAMDARLTGGRLLRFDRASTARASTTSSRRPPPDPPRSARLHRAFPSRSSGPRRAQSIPRSGVADPSIRRRLPRPPSRAGQSGSQLTSTHLRAAPSALRRGGEDPRSAGLSPPKRRGRDLNPRRTFPARTAISSRAP